MKTSRSDSSSGSNSRMKKTTIKRTGKKGVVIDTRKSIQTWHSEKMQQFKDDKERLPALKKKICEIQDEIDRLSGMDIFDNDRDKENRKLRSLFYELKDKKNAIHEDILRIESGDEEMQYMMNAFPLYLRYEELKEQEERGIVDPKDEYSNKKLSNDLSSFVNNGNKDSELSRVIHEYLLLTDPNYRGNGFAADDYSNNDFLAECPSGCKVPDYIVNRECDIVCFNCGLVIGDVSVDPSNISYKQSQEMEISSQYKYEKLNHFREKLAQFQGKENTEIPEEVMQKIRDELKKYRIKDYGKIDKKLLNHVLHKCKLNTYGEHATYIIQTLGGREVKQMTPEMEQTLESMFLLTLGPFEKYKPKDRKNYNGYEYTIFKLCQLKEWDSFLPNLKLPKSNEIRQEHDKVWKKICRARGWCFYDTLTS